jgi:hypothetical protein
MSSRRRVVPRLALTPAESAEALGIGLTTFKQKVQPQLRIVRAGKLRMIPVSELERWLDENAEMTLCRLGKELSGKQTGCDPGRTDGNG